MKEVEGNEEQQAGRVYEAGSCYLPIDQLLIMTFLVAAASQQIRQGKLADYFAIQGIFYGYVLPEIFFGFMLY